MQPGCCILFANLHSRTATVTARGCTLHSLHCNPSQQLLSHLRLLLFFTCAVCAIIASKPPRAEAINQHKQIAWQFASTGKLGVVATTDCSIIAPCCAIHWQSLVVGYGKYYSKGVNVQAHCNVALANASGNRFKCKSLDDLAYLNRITMARHLRSHPYGVLLRWIAPRQSLE